MKVEVLVATMHQNDHSLVEKMNIQTDAIIINQCDRNQFEEIEYKGRKIKFLSFSERGVGLSRNNSLMRATGDICLFADDDVKYDDGYEEKIIQAFEENPDASLIIFNLRVMNLQRQDFEIIKKTRLRFYNCLKYGTYRIAVRTSDIYYANIFFSLLFGGGAKYSAGEDSLFLTDCIKKGLICYALPINIGEVSHTESTWFKGYNEKFFFDKGVFFAVFSKRWAKLLCLQLLIRHKKMWKDTYKFSYVYRLMLEGAKEVK